MGKTLIQSIWVVPYERGGVWGEASQIWIFCDHPLGWLQFRRKTPNKTLCWHFWHFNCTFFGLLALFWGPILNILFQRTFLALQTPTRVYMDGNTMLDVQNVAFWQKKVQKWQKCQKVPNPHIGVYGIACILFF